MGLIAESTLNSGGKAIGVEPQFFIVLPAMSAVQDEPARVKNMTRRAIKTCVYVIAPLMMAMFFCAEPLVRLVLTMRATGGSFRRGCLRHAIRLR